MVGGSVLILNNKQGKYKTDFLKAQRYESVFKKRASKKCAECIFKFEPYLRGKMLLSATSPGKIASRLIGQITVQPVVRPVFSQAPGVSAQKTIKTGEFSNLR